MIIITLSILVILIYRTNRRLNENAVIQEEFSKVYWRMDKAAGENARALDKQIIERTTNINKRLDYIIRWVKHAAKTARENRDVMLSHDNRVLELEILIKKIEEKYLKDKKDQPPTP